MRLLGIIAVASIATGCCRDGSRAEGGAAGAGAAGAPAGLPPFVDATSEKPWGCRTVLQEDAQTIRERVCFKSGDLQIVGQVCRPRRAGRFPVIVYGHAHLFGLGPEWQGGPCQAIAADGNVVVMPSFRGQDGSEGKVEGCAGEVDDALSMLDQALAQPYADQKRTAWTGMSHGGCVVLKALAKGTQSKAALVLFPTVDWAATFTHWDARVKDNSLPALTPMYRAGVTELAKAFGGPPATQPAEYQRRSVVSDDIEKNPTPLFITHGIPDPILPVAATCKLAAGLSGITAFRSTSKGEGSTEVVKGCEDPKLALRADGPAAATKGNRVLGLYDGALHDISSVDGQRMARDGYAFLKARLAAPDDAPK